MIAGDKRFSALSAPDHDVGCVHRNAALIAAVGDHRRGEDQLGVRDGDDVLLMKLFFAGNPLVVDDDAVGAAAVHYVVAVLFPDDLRVAFGNGNVRERNIAAFLPADGQFLLPGKGHRLPLIVRIVGGKDKEHTFGNRLHAVVDADKIAVAERTGRDGGVVVDQPVCAAGLLIDRLVLDGPMAVPQAEAAVLGRDKGRFQNNVVALSPAEGYDPFPIVSQSDGFRLLVPVKNGDQQTAGNARQGPGM